MKFLVHSGAAPFEKKIQNLWGKSVLFSDFSQLWVVWMLRMLILKSALFNIYVSYFLKKFKTNKTTQISNAHFLKKILIMLIIISAYYDILLSFQSWMEFGFICQNLFFNEYLLGNDI